MMMRYNISKKLKETFFNLYLCHCFISKFLFKKGQLCDCKSNMLEFYFCVIKKTDVSKNKKL